MTLLEQAQAAAPRHNENGYVYGPEDYELALALLAGVVTPAQATAAWGMSKKAGSSLYARAFGALRLAYQAGLRFHWEKEPFRRPLVDGDWHAPSAPTAEPAEQEIPSAHNGSAHEEP